MKNTLRIALSLMAAAALMGCQKNADKQGVSVRGSRAMGANGIVSTGSVSTVTVDQNIASLSQNPALQMVQANIPTANLFSGSVVGARLGVRLCPQTALANSSAPQSFASNGGRIQVDLYDQWATQGLAPLSTALTFIQGYTQNVNGYMYIAAEFGDAYGTIAIDGYLDGTNLLNGRVFENTLMNFNQQSLTAGMQQLGTFSITQAELLGCN